MKKHLIRIGIVFLVLIVAALTFNFVLAQMSNTAPDQLGVRNGKLAACPESPNCVCSQADSEAHRVDSFELTGDQNDVFQELIAIVKRQPRSKIITEQADYLHAEFRSPIFRFVDDFECFLDTSETPARIHFRSASRVGHSDLGANRKRVVRIRNELNQQRK